MPEKELPEIIGKAIAFRRRVAGMTQEELADMLGIAPDTLSRMENGRFAPKMGRLRSIAAALRCSVTDLFRETDEKTADRASTIAEILKPLPDDVQTALVELMRQAACVIRKH